MLMYNASKNFYLAFYNSSVIQKGIFIMRVGVIQNYNAGRNVAFGNLTKEEKEGFLQTKKAALDIIGHPDRSVFIYSSACLPQSADTNTGTGTLISKQGQELMDVVKTYTTANIMQDLPSGELIPNPVNNFYCAYEGSGMSLSPHLIEPELLMDESMGKLINADDLKYVVEANDVPGKDVFATFENVVEPGSRFESMLKKAYDKFKTGEGDKIEALRKEFSEYKNANSEWLEPHAIHDALSKKYGTPMFIDWAEEVDRKLYDTDFPQDLRDARKAAVLKDHADEIDFYDFKQFLAEKSLSAARDKAHAQGIKLGGDVAYNFSLSDVFSNPKAFVYDVYMGQPEFKFPALDFYKIGDPNSPSAKILAQKIRLAAQRYDTLRLDMGWGYITPILSNKNGDYYEQKEMGSQVADFIENIIKDVKGDKFDKHDIFYEVEAGEKDFRAFTDDGKLIEPLKDRTKIYTSAYMNDGWGSTRAFNERFHFGPNEYIYGASNQDTTPLSQLAAESAYAERKSAQVKELATILHVEPSSLENADAFIRAKNAEPLLAKNNFMFFTEFFRLPNFFNLGSENGVESFRTKIPANPEQAYFDAVKEGKAYNLMDGLEQVFRAKGFDQQHPDLFAKIVEYKNKLYGTNGQTASSPAEASKGAAETAVSTVAEPPVINPVTTEGADEVVNGTKVAAGDAAEAAAEGAKKPGAELTQSVKKNKYMKPALIIAGVLIAGYSAYKFLSKKPKAA